MVNEARIRVRNDRPVCDGPVIYWMQRDQRVHDNWALLYAQQCALENDTALIVVFNLVPTYGYATWRHYDFMLRGLRETAAELQRFNIPFFILEGQPEATIPALIVEQHAGHLVTDFNPMKLPESWKHAVAKKLTIRFSEVDAHNIVPCWEASDKQEFAAYTLRPKIHKKLKGYLEPFPKVKNETANIAAPTIHWEKLLERVDVNRDIEPIEWLLPGSVAAADMLDTFVSERLDHYHLERNNPLKNAQSNLSPYLHFGQISAQRVALSVQKARVPKDAKNAFLEELIVRKELSDNYCFYTEDYDKLAGAHAWAQETIKQHAKDAREYVYTKQQFEAGETHDELWNAMQMALVDNGKLHGWCRMYWAKKILEWTPDVQTAIDIALCLNDTYELDGRDPNGVVGVMWSMCGVHDRAWTERQVFGKIRYMNLSGAKRKFDVAGYITRYGRADKSLFDD